MGIWWRKPTALAVLCGFALGAKAGGADSASHVLSDSALTCPQRLVELPAATAERNLVRNTILHFARAFLTPEESKDLVITREHFVWPDRPLPKEVREAFTLSSRGSYVDSLKPFMGAEFALAYIEHRAIRQPNLVLPSNVAELKAQLGYDSAVYPSNTLDKWEVDSTNVWRRKLLTQSRITDEIRAIYRAKINGSIISIADTRGELEIAIQRPGGQKAWDFYAYNLQGRVETRPLFRTTRDSVESAPAPYACMACHYSAHTQSFELVPSMLRR